MPVVKSVLPVCCPSPIGITSESLDPNGFETAEKSSNNDKMVINCIFLPVVAAGELPTGT